MRTNIKSKKSESQSSQLAREYQIVINWSDEDQLYLASVPAFRGVVTHGHTLEEAAKNGFEVLEMVIDNALKDGKKLPPSCANLSGRLSLRLTPDLHAEVWRKAERAGTSINQYIAAQLMRAP